MFWKKKLLFFDVQVGGGINHVLVECTFFILKNLFQDFHSSVVNIIIRIIKKCDNWLHFIKTYFYLPFFFFLMKNL